MSGLIVKYNIVKVRKPSTVKSYFKSKDAQKYKVVKIMRKSGRRQIIEKNLTEAEAQRVVKRYPNSTRSMVVYMKQ